MTRISRNETEKMFRWQVYKFLFNISCILNFGKLFIQDIFQQISVHIFKDKIKFKYQFFALMYRIET